MGGSLPIHRVEAGQGEKPKILGYHAAVFADELDRLELVATTLELLHDRTESGADDRRVPSKFVIVDFASPNYSRR